MASLKQPTLNIISEQLYDDIDCIDEVDDDITSRTTCGGNCLINVMQILVNYNFLSSSYENMYRVYKTLLTLPMTQVCCERTFSQLKLIKTRLRTSLTQENLEAFMLMKLNRQWTDEIDSASIVEKLCTDSKVFNELLQY